ncbi:MAG: branched-chain amino acid aminotransferase [Planctomycetaceae bacterium]
MLTLKALIHDENGFVVSAELIIVSTVAILALVVGFSEISFSVNNELEDVGSAVGAMNQSFYVNGVQSVGKGGAVGSSFDDYADYCDSQTDVIAAGARSENDEYDYEYYGR